MAKNGNKNNSFSNDQKSNANNPNNKDFKQNQDNHANQNNPNNDAYWQSRGYSERPDDWADLIEKEEDQE